MFAGAGLAYAAIAVAIKVCDSEFVITILYFFEKHFAVTRYVRDANGTALLVEGARLANLQSN